MASVLKLQTEAISTGFGCNISSGIILEKLVEDKPKKLPIYFNVKTLFRNYIGCLDGNADAKIKALKNHVSARPVINGFIDDTKLLINGFLDSGFELHFYNIDYKPFLKNVLNARKEEEFKGLKSVVRKIEKFAITEVKRNFPGIYIEYKNPKLKGKVPKEIYMVTHIGIELLNFVGNVKVKLIESHTGVIKESTEWYSKYAKIGNRKMSVFPLDELLYNILGDNDYVKQGDIKLRKHLYNIAVEMAWSGFMLPNEIEVNLRNKDPLLLNGLKSRYKKYF